MAALPYAHLCPLKEASRSRHSANSRSLSSSDSSSPVSCASRNACMAWCDAQCMGHSDTVRSIQLSKGEPGREGANALEGGGAAGVGRAHRHCS